MGGGGQAFFPRLPTMGKMLPPRSNGNLDWRGLNYICLEWEESGSVDKKAQTRFQSSEHVKNSFPCVIEVTEKRFQGRLLKFQEWLGHDTSHF